MLHAIGQLLPAVSVNVSEEGRCERHVGLWVGCIQNSALQMAALPAGQAGEAAGALLQQHQQHQQRREGHCLDGGGDDEGLLEVQLLNEQPAGTPHTSHMSPSQLPKELTIGLA